MKFTLYLTLIFSAIALIFTGRYQRSRRHKSKVFDTKVCATDPQKCQDICDNDFKSSTKIRCGTKMIFERASAKKILCKCDKTKRLILVNLS